MSLVHGLVGTLLPFVGAIPGSVITRRNIRGWYEHLDRPAWRPPNWAFGPVWTALYAGMGYARCGSRVVVQFYCVNWLMFCLFLIPSDWKEK